MVKCSLTLRFWFFFKSTFWFEQLIISIKKNQHAEGKVQRETERLTSAERAGPWRSRHKDLDWGSVVSPLKPLTLYTGDEAQRPLQTLLCSRVIQLHTYVSFAYSVMPTQWTRTWVNSRSWWWTGRPGVLQSMGLQSIRHDWATELNWTPWDLVCPFFKFQLASANPRLPVHPAPSLLPPGNYSLCSMSVSRFCFVGKFNYAVF